ncbi:hypothetical protein JQX13_47405 [Archangium violaceum]|uniref:hypothetical protein n=1 Tax=Archangium violaceum TaxID=83451 RepID=UPI00193B7220|nr:hypothetical protein [Archangium violaceum]QRK07553.1 hypothetical protein JQX13_47405 [Archangium violaceum]
MKRFIVSLMVVAGALLSACTESQEYFQSAGLAGTYDLALVGRLLFVTSADNDELRVLSLTDDADARRFVRAPNPLETLSIPVLQRPQALTRDVRYVDRAEDEDADPDDEVTGSYVYARSSGSTEISVVGAAPERLDELRRLDTRQLSAHLPDPAARSSGPVTTFAALALPAAEGQQEGGSTLYYATQEVSGARLWQVRLPGPEQLTADTPLSAEPLDVALPSNVAVTSLLVMPQPGLLAVSTRSPAGSTTPGKSYLVNLVTKELRELNFGAQVLQLATHGRVVYKDAQNNEQTLRAGQRIFGVLDASSCVGLSQCTGVLAVETDSGTVAQDVTGYPMLPLSAGAGLPMGLSLSTNTKLGIQTGEPADRVNPEDPSTTIRRDTVVELLGIVPLSNGQVLFFDAARLTPFNVAASWDTANGQTVNTATATTLRVNAQGVSQGETGDIYFEGTYGVTRDQTFVLTYEGVLPVVPQAREGEGSPFVVSSAIGPEPDRETLVQPGDIIVLLPGSTGQACSEDLRVASVQSTAETGTFVLVPSGPVPAACAGYTSFEVRAGGSRPLVLSNASGTFLERLGLRDDYSRTGSYFFHPPGYQGQTEATQVYLRVDRLPEEELNRGDYYLVSTESHYFPYVITVDTVNVTDFAYYRLPGPVVHARVGEEDYAYIVYPSADGILQVDLTDIDAGVANSRGLYPYQ